MNEEKGFYHAVGDKSLELAPFDYEYDNILGNIEHNVLFLLRAYRRDFNCRGRQLMHTREFDDCLESGNADQVIALFIQASLKDLKVATALFNNSSFEAILGWCWCASENLLYEGNKRIPPQTLFDCLWETALIATRIRSDANGMAAQKYRYIYPDAYTSFCSISLPLYV